MSALLKTAATLPAIALLAACSTTAPTMPMPAPQTSETVTDTAYDRMAHVPYQCSDDSTILAKQSINKKQVMLNATLPKVNWSGQELLLNGGVTGDTASYVNDANPEVTYAWHMTGDEGILAMKWANGKEYQVNCTVGR